MRTAKHGTGTSRDAKTARVAPVEASRPRRALMEGKCEDLWSTHRCQGRAMIPFVGKLVKESPDLQIERAHRALAPGRCPTHVDSSVSEVKKKYLN